MSVLTGSNDRPSAAFEAERSIVVGATQVIAALGADQLAMVACEPEAAGGADLAMVIDRGCTGLGGIL